MEGEVGVFFFNDTATTEIYTLSLHDALPIFRSVCGAGVVVTLDEDRRVAAVRASYVSVGLVPQVHDLTEAVHGSPVDSADWAGAAALARGKVEPDSDLHASADYRRLLVGVLTERTLAEAAAEAAGRSE